MGLLSLYGIMAISWSMTGIAMLMTAGRYILRYRNSGRFFWDDAAHGLALIFLVVMIAAFTAADDSITKSEGKLSLSGYYNYRRIELVVSIFFWLCVYSVKLAFLLLYRTLFGVSRTFNRAWWAVTTFTFLTFWVCIAGVFTICGQFQNFFNQAYCKSAPMVHNSVVVLEYSGVVHVLSDLAIMALPLYFLKRLMMRTTQKIGLAAVFSLGIFVVAFDILRTVFSIVGAQASLWDSLEATVAVIVSCLPVYYVLMTSRKPPTDKVHTDYTHQERLVHTQPSIELVDGHSAVDGARSEYANIQKDIAEHKPEGSFSTASAFADESMKICPPEAVHAIAVRQEYSVTRGN